MIRFAGALKAKIQEKLQELVDSQTIGSYLMDELVANPLTLDFPSFPCMVLGLASQDSADYETNRGNLRTYEFPLLLIARPDDFLNDTKRSFEDLVDDISFLFDNDPTLGGIADGGVDASFTRPSPINSSDKAYVVTFAIIRARAYVALTF